jgi:hypothetical protein
LSDYDVQSGTITSTGASATGIVDVPCNGMTGAFVTVNGTFSGIVCAFEASTDGINWQSVITYRVDSTATTAYQNNVTFGTNATVQYYAIIGGFQRFRLRATAYTSGTANVNIMTCKFAQPIAPFQSGIGAPASLADGLANPNVGNVSAEDMLFNGTTWDRARANTNVTVDASSAKTATGNGATATNFDSTGAFIFVNVTAVSGTTPTLVAKVQHSFDGTTFTDLDATNAATASITTAGLYVIKVFPGIPTVAAGSCNSPLPRTWRLTWTIGGTTPSFTFSSTAAYIKG